MGIDATDDNTEQDSVLVPLKCANSCPEMLARSPPARTLLPRSIANAVSFATRSTSLALRIGTVIGGYGFDAAQTATLSSLELGRVILHETLNRAGHDVLSGSPSDPARADAESLLAGSLESMHRTMSRICFWTAAGFHAAGTTASTASQISQIFLSVLDQFLGSTDSSRAIASIITLIRRELQNPATGVEGEKVGVIDLVLGLCGLAYLQNECQKMIRDESRRLGYEEIIWDMVLNHDACVGTFQDGTGNVSRAQSPSACDPHPATGAIGQHGMKHGSVDPVNDEGNHLFEAQLTKQLSKSLPKDANISVFVSSTTTTRITVTMTGDSRMPIPSFPGLDLVESEVSDTHHVPQGSRDQTTKYRIVYSVSRNREGSILQNNQQEARPHINDSVKTHFEQTSSPTGLGTEKVQATPPIPLKFMHSTASSVRRRDKTLNKGLTLQPVEMPDNSTGHKVEPPKGQHFRDWMANTSPVNRKKSNSPLEPQRKFIQEPLGNVRPLDKKAKKISYPSLVRCGEKRTGVQGSTLEKDSSQNRQSNLSDMVGVKLKSSIKPAWSGPGLFQSPPLNTSPRRSAPERTPSGVLGRDTSRPSQQGNSNTLSPRNQILTPDSNRDEEQHKSPMSPVGDSMQRSPTSRTDESPTTSQAVEEDDIKSSPRVTAKEQACNVRFNMSQEIHLQSASQNYTLETHNPQTSLLVSSAHLRSAYCNSIDLDSLRMSEGAKRLFPRFHFLRNISRYSRYASAVYGHSFLKLMGILKDWPATNMADQVHYDVRSFAHHTKLPCDSILLSSFVDSQGGSDSTGATHTGIPLVHTVALDKESKAVVLTCRGTLGFEDILADMMCDYDELVWRGKTYNVHKGIHASARRLLYGGDGRVLLTIKAALEQYSDYGLVLCGHSLGGSVTALLGVMLAEPSNTGAGFITSHAGHQEFLGSGDASEMPVNTCLPSGRPIHVYAYGPPATMSPSLQVATRGLITSTVHGHDLVPYLSLGVLHDFQALALAFKSDNYEAKAEVKRRVWAGLRSGLADKLYSNPTKQSNEDEAQWAYVALKTLRASMVSSKLLPPGEVFKVESTKVMRKDEPAVTESGQPTSRIVFKYIRDVEAYFRQVCFGASMLTDHSPGRYEDALGRLASSVVGI
ncbi:hypothetical protein GGS21DRAFT_257462 [Xylaria nigripes]|nr:hypothetical protein GGS21DRAFT_257462 [Xylaria nigripes]